jgi:arylsulfatase A-like enzyme
MDRPLNVLFIIADQFRADCLGYTGNTTIKTPHLDRLAAQGATFTNCFNQTAPCGPSRMCIYTSRYLCSHRAVNNCTPLLDAQDNYGYALRQAGYRPGLVGYNDYAIDPDHLPHDDPRQTSLHYDNVLPGFERAYYHEYDSDEYFDFLRQQGYPETLLSHSAIHQPNVPDGGPGDHLPQHFPAHYRPEHSECRFVTEKALEFLRQQKSEYDATTDKGWMLSLNFIKPHPPNVCCAPYHDLYDPTSMPPAVRQPAELNPTHPYLKLLAADALEQDNHLQEYRACYYGMINEVDDNIGLIFDYLDASNQWDDTLIIFSSDHGEYLGDHYLTGKGQFYDGALNIPYIIRDPSAIADATRGQIFNHFIESIDSAPTLLEYLDVAIPDRFQGRSLLPLLRGASYTPKTEIYHEFDYRSRVLATASDTDPDQHLLWIVRDAQYKYVHFADANMPPLLFDLQHDPGEFTNLADHPDHQPAVLRYCQKLLRWRMRHEDQRMEHWAQPMR